MGASKGALLRGVLRDFCGLVGAALIAWGAYEIYRPAGFIAAGVLLLSAATMAARAGGE